MFGQASLTKALLWVMIGWSSKHHSHLQFLPHVFDLNHVRTLSAQFKDFDMLILELNLHYVGGMFWIIVLLILLAEPLLQFLLRFFSRFPKNLGEIPPPPFNDTVNHHLSFATDREASPTDYISANMLYVGHSVL